MVEVNVDEKDINFYLSLFHNKLCSVWKMEHIVQYYYSTLFNSIVLYHCTWWHMKYYCFSLEMEQKLYHSNEIIDHISVPRHIMRYPWAVQHVWELGENANSWAALRPASSKFLRWCLGMCVVINTLFGSHTWKTLRSCGHCISCFSGLW